MIQLSNSWFVEDNCLCLNEGDKIYKIEQSDDSPGCFIVYSKREFCNNTWEKLKNCENFEEACMYAAI